MKTRTAIEGAENPGALRRPTIHRARNSRGPAIWILAATLALVLTVPAAGAETPTTAPADASAYEARLIRPAGTPPGSPRTSGTTGAADDWGVLRVLGAMGIVLAAIFAMRWAGKRFFGLNVPGGAAGPVRVLSRTMISPRQQIVLVRVGKRVIVVANSGAQMTTLSEITDPDEVASLAGSLAEEKPPAGASFLAMFGRAEAPYDEAAPTPQPAEEGAVAQVRTELGGLLEKVRGLSATFRKGEAAEK